MPPEAYLVSAAFVFSVSLRNRKKP